MELLSFSGVRHESRGIFDKPKILATRWRTARRVRVVPRGLHEGGFLRCPPCSERFGPIRNGYLCWQRIRYDFGPPE